MINALSHVTLVYRGEDGTEYEQPLADIVETGNLLDPESEDDLDLVGWRTVPEQDAAIFAAACDAASTVASYQDSDDEGCIPEGQPIVESFQYLRELISDGIRSYLQTAWLPN